AQRSAVEELDLGMAEGIDLGSLAERMVQVAERNRLAFRDYRPAPFDGKVHHLRAVERLDIDTPQPVDDGGSWRRVIADLVRHDIAGTHYSLLDGEHAEGLAETLAGIVEEDLSYAEI
ncbi:hypothetical protein ACFQ07_05760, partial [Actinomadura adrarensis]